jgi:aryl-alcohol dehydrogenase-like predicted oxidoreductase
MAEVLPPDVSLKEAAVRFVPSRQEVSSAFVGFSAADQIDQVALVAAKEGLPSHLMERLGA